MSDWAGDNPRRPAITQVTRIVTVPRRSARWLFRFIPLNRARYSECLVALSLQKGAPMRFPYAQRRGFTLIETMTVVVIVGVLATLAVYSVRRYINAAKSGEARQMILNIKAAEEAYRGETYQYLATASNLTGTGTLYPHVCLGLTPERTKVAWEQADTCTQAKAMRTLGVTATAPVMYGYSVAVATGGAMPTLPSTSTFKWGAAASVNGPAFAVVAMGDVDGDGAFSVFVSSSLTDEVYADNDDE